MKDIRWRLKKKKIILRSLTRKIPNESWRFLTGDSVNIYKISDALGILNLKEGNDFIHGASIMVVSPGGKIVRYFYGTDYLPLILNGVTEASRRKVIRQ